MKAKYLIAAGSAAAAMSLASCADDAATMAPDDMMTVNVTLTVDRESQSPDGRLTHSEDADGLNAAWEQGDQLLFCYNHTDKEATAQTLTLQSIDASDASVATFAGTVTIPASAVTENSLSHAAIAYLGKSDAATYRPVQTTTYVDLTQQDGRFDAMAWNDAMSLRDITLAVEGNNATAASTLNLNHHMAFAHFKANLPAGSTVTISGNTYMRLTLNIPGTDTKETAWGIETTTWAASKSIHVEASATSRITVPDGPGDHTGDAGTGGSDDPDGTGSGSSSAGGTISAASHFYVALLPFENPQEITFTATDPDGNEYTASLSAQQLEAGHYYRAGYDASLEEQSRSKGIYVNFTEVNDDPEPSPADDTVGPTFTINGKNYRFTSGNLYYNTEAETWHIFPNQTEFVNAGGLSVSGTSYGTDQTPELIGLFSWGATGLEDAQKPTTLKKNASDKTFPGTNFPTTEGQSKNSSIRNLWDNEYVYDWGRAYQESGRAADDNRQYITPSMNTFKELFEGCFVQGCTIKKGAAEWITEDVTGLIAIPGTYTLEEAKTFIRSVEGADCLSSMKAAIHNNSGSTLSYKNITITDYAALKKLNDAVFFPAARKRNLSSGTVNNSNGEGWYWSSYAGTATNAANLYFNGTKGGFYYSFTISGGTVQSNNANMGRFNQMAVRLLVEVTE